MDALDRFNGLKSLDLTWCRHVTDRSIRFLSGEGKSTRPCPDLDSLNLSQCNSISSDAVSKLKLALPRLRVQIGTLKPLYTTSLLAKIRSKNQQQQQHSSESYVSSSKNESTKGAKMGDEEESGENISHRVVPSLLARMRRKFGESESENNHGPAAIGKSEGP